MPNWFEQTGLLPGTAFVVASNADDDTIRQARILKDRYQGLIQVCDGTNDQVEIAAALAELSAIGGKVVLSEGTFNVTTFTIPTLKSIQGQGYACTTINTTGGIVSTGGAIYDLTIATVQATFTGSALKINANKISIFYGYDTTKIIDKVRFYQGTNGGGSGIALHLYAESDATTVGCIYTNIGDIGIHGYQYGVKIEVNKAGAADCYINGCYFNQLRIYGSDYPLFLTITGAGTIAANYFNYITLEALAATLVGITLCGTRNTVEFYDEIDLTASKTSLNITSGSYNRVRGRFDRTITDSGTYTSIEHVDISHAFCDIFNNCRAATVNYIHAAVQDLSGTHSDVACPDVPRNLSVTQAGTGVAKAGDVVITGKNAQGYVITETIAVPAANGTVYGSKAFSVVTSLVGYLANVDETLSVGISDKLGLLYQISASGDVYKIKRNQTNEGAGTVDVTNRTVNIADGGGAIVNLDDFAIYYQGQPNIIES